MGDNSQFPDTESRAQVWCGVVGGAEGRECGERGVGIKDGLPQFVVAAPSADQEEGKAGVALVKNDKAREIVLQKTLEIKERLMRKVAGGRGNPGRCIIKIIPFQNGRTELHGRAGNSVFGAVGIDLGWGV